MRKKNYSLVSALLEKADPAGVDSKRFPLKLTDAGKVSGDRAEVLVTGGNEDGNADDDIVDAQPASKAVKLLLPSQSSMDVYKAVCFALAAIKKMAPFKGGPGGDLGAIITSDNHIMDGHHRWIASGMIDPTSEVGGYVVEFPAKEMIAALNMITVHLTGRSEGKGGSGGFDQFNKEGILAVLKKFVKDGAEVPGKGKWSGLEGPVVLEACESFSGVSGEAAVDAAAKKMADNVSELTLSVPKGFPERSDMPVISKDAGHLKKAIELLRAGDVDLNAPYSPKSEEEKGEVKEEGVKRRKKGMGNLKEAINRWGHLAGFDKD